MGAQQLVTDEPPDTAPPAALSTRRMTPEQHTARQAAARRAGALAGLGDALEESATLIVPPPVTEVVPRKRGVTPKLPAEAFELARKVYFVNHGSMTDCARAVLAAGLSETDDLVQVRERLQTWWAREEWPKRPMLGTFAIRDANFDGGLYRSARLCISQATGNGPAPKGKKCPQSALADSDYCYHHDPRPEYVEARRVQAARLAESRGYDMVPIAPFCEWMDQERKRLLAQARAAGHVHPNNTGWSLLARRTGVDQSVIGRMMKGNHNGGAARRGELTDTIRASTLVRYLEPTGVSFKDLYGFDPPARRDSGPWTCPSCGGRKNHGSKVCRPCHDAEGTPCSYVNRRGKRCNVPTKHASGVCAKCRQITERVHRPRTGRPSFLSVPMLTLATGEYRDVPSHAWVARRMWAANAGGVRDVFKTQKSLVGSLAKHFRKHRWLSTADAAAAHARLVTEHGDVPWPSAEGHPLEAAGMVPFAPFARWLTERRDELGSYKALTERIHVNPDNISKWLRGVVPKTTVRRATVDQALAAWGDGTTFADLYAGEAS
jgi:hypothetical protein